MHAKKSPPVPCLLSTWAGVESLLFHWLSKQCRDHELAFDLLQDTFLRALQLESAFCEIANQKAWLFRVAGNLLTDELRKQRKVHLQDLDDYPTLSETAEQPEPVDSLAQCLPKALACLNNEDREIIEYCDLQGHPQQDFAVWKGLSVSATKSRIQRARDKLRSKLKANCRIRFDENNRICCFFPEEMRFPDE